MVPEFVLDEDEVLRPRADAALAQTVERLRRLVDQRHGAHPSRFRRSDLSVRVALLDVDDAVREVDVHPPQRSELAEPQSGEARDPEERCVLVALCGPCERLDLGRREDGEVAGVAERLPFHERGGVLPQPEDLHRAAEDAMQDHEPLVDRPVAQFALGDEPRSVRVDPLLGDLLERQVAELWVEREVDHAAVVRDRRRPPLSVVLDIPEVLGARIPEDDA